MNETIGIKLACAAHGLSGPEFDYLSHAMDTIEDEGAVMHKQAAALAAQMYEATGKQENLGYHLFKKLAAWPGRWSEGYTQLVKPVYEALGRNTPAEGNRFEKTAMLKESMMQGVLGSAGKLVSNLPEYYEKALMASLAGGGAAGALAWQMGEDDIEKDEEAAKMQAQLEYLNSVTEDIDDSLRQRGVPA